MTTPLFCEGETEHGSLKGQNVVLFPPSYFKTTVDSGQAEPGECERAAAAAAASPASTYVISPCGSGRSLHHKEAVGGEEEIAALRLQNQALRSQLQAVHHTPSTALPLLHPHYTTPGILTSDLLQVESGLQSQLVHSEAERRRLTGQLAALETTLREERDAHGRDKESLICQHHAAMEQVTRARCEVEEKWRREGDEWRERVGRVEEREREKVEEMKLAQEEIAKSAQENSSLVSELEEERKSHREETASLQDQLSSTEDQNRTLQSELQAVRGRVRQLESYLGGELPEEGSGVTWKDERETLLDRLRASEEVRERMESETQLMAVRLAAISEILSLQEARLTQGKEGHVLVERPEVMEQSQEEGVIGGEVKGGEGGGVKGLLSLWREKVFALLVQGRLQQIQHSRDTEEAQCRISGLQGEVSEATRGRDLVSHTLTDRTAQLQLQINRTEDLERRLQQAEQACQASQSTADRLSSLLQAIVTGVCEAGEKCARVKSCVDGCMSRLANYELRVGVVTRRVASLRAMLSSQLVLHGASGMDHPHSCDTSTQTEVPERAQELSKLPHGVLVEEVESLMRERDTLTDQLSQSTAALQQLRNTASARQETLEQTCSTLQADNTSLSQHLEDARAELEGHREGEAQLRSMQASLQARIDSAVMEERRKGRHELGEAHSLLEVARREQSKTALQLQQAERRLHCERDSAVEAVEVSKRGVEEELERCRDRLRAVQVERNLLLTTLRQEGIKIPPKRPPPRQLSTPAAVTQDDNHTAELSMPPSSSFHPTPLTTDEQPQTTVKDSLGTSCSDRDSRSPSPCSSAENCINGRGTDGQSESEPCGDGHPEVVQQTGEMVSRIMTGTTPHDNHTTALNDGEDIHNVLKELQMLSTSLLQMKTLS